MLFKKAKIIFLLMVSMFSCVKSMEEARPVLNEQQLRDHVISSVMEVNAEPGYEITPLMYVILTPEIGAAIPLFLDEINAQSQDGLTALMIAVETGRIGLVGLLLERGADVNLKNSNGQTALDLAIKQNNTILIKMLRDELTHGFQMTKPTAMAIDQSEQKEEEPDIDLYSETEFELNENDDLFAAQLNASSLLDEQREATDTDDEADQFSDQLSKPLEKNQVKKLKCSVSDCHKIFRCQRDLTQHNEIVHLGIKRFVCDFEGCGYRTGYPTTFKRHRALHEKKNMRKMHTAASSVKATAKKRSAKKSMSVHNAKKNLKRHPRAVCKEKKKK